MNLLLIDTGDRGQELVLREDLEVLDAQDPILLRILVYLVLSISRVETGHLF